MVVENLQPSTSYIMMVSARNHAGYGKESKFKVKTLSQNLEGYQSGEFSILVLKLIKTPTLLAELTCCSSYVHEQYVII